MDRREELEKQMVNERKTNSYKDWMRLQTMKKKQTRKYNQRQKVSKNDMKARQMAQAEEMQQNMVRQAQQQMDHDDMDGEDPADIAEYY